ncbi:MAG: Uma2 family endonuclease [Phycisphaeraceae bacterium]
MPQTTSPKSRTITAAQLLAMGDIGRCELIRGNLIMMSPAGYQHGGIIGNIHGLLWTYVRKHGLGVVLGAETGFLLDLNPDTVRAPDVAFIRKDRLPPSDDVKFFRGAPDLAVEVLSPEDRAGEVMKKIGDWLSGGAASVWIVNPKKRIITAYHADQTTVTYRAGETLKDDPAVPGFKMHVNEVFE